MVLLLLLGATSSLVNQKTGLLDTVHLPVRALPACGGQAALLNYKSLRRHQTS
jgi:hypothetical protein